MSLQLDYFELLCALKRRNKYYLKSNYDECAALAYLLDRHALMGEHSFVFEFLFSIANSGDFNFLVWATNNEFRKLEEQSSAPSLDRSYEVFNSSVQYVPASVPDEDIPGWFHDIYSGCVNMQYKKSEKNWDIAPTGDSRLDEVARYLAAREE